jgi:hypothetical protein
MFSSLTYEAQFWLTAICAKVSQLPTIEACNLNLLILLLFIGTSALAVAYPHLSPPHPSELLHFASVFAPVAPLVVDPD